MNIAQRHLSWLNLFIACEIALCLSSPNAIATQPAFKPLPLAKKLDYSDSVFLGTVKNIYFYDRNNSVLEPSQVNGLAGSMAEVEVRAVNVDRRKKLDSVVRVPIGGRASTAKERLEKYDGKTFVFFGKSLYVDDAYGKAMPLIRLVPDNGVDDPSNLVAIRRAAELHRWAD
jgi:hypothetical protein